MACSYNSGVYRLRCRSSISQASGQRLMFYVYVRDTRGKGGRLFGRPVGSFVLTGACKSNPGRAGYLSSWMCICL